MVLRTLFTVTMSLEPIELSIEKTPIIFLTTLSKPSDVETANLSARWGENLLTESTLTLCQIGRIFFLPATISIDASEFSSRWGHCLSKKLGLSITMPNFEFVMPSSMDLLRLSPIFNENSSNHTVNPFLVRAFTSGRAISSLSSLAWEIKKSKLFTNLPQNITNLSFYSLANFTLIFEYP